MRWLPLHMQRDDERMAERESSKKRRISFFRLVLPALWMMDDKAAKEATKFYYRLFPKNIRKMTRWDSVKTT